MEGTYLSVVPEVILFRNVMEHFNPEPAPKLNFLDERSRKPVLMTYAGTGRNEPCPCSSGKKYKKCCIGEVAEVK